MELIGRSDGDNIVRSTGGGGVNGGLSSRQEAIKDKCCFQLPLHYPRYTKLDYETMSEWTLDRLLAQYGLPATGDINDKRKFAMGAFIWN